MTGEDEWRLVHVDGAGQFTDSLVHKKPGDAEEKGPSLLASRVQGIGASAEVIELPGDPNVSNNPALQRRASDRISPGMQAPGGDAGQDGPVAMPDGGGRSRRESPCRPKAAGRRGTRA
ncbi:MAG: hypothetical protein MZV70_19290 [Desulfobacterales bacterium]|nr:hypothetical protein [Desulfobacterales bacterium]